MECNKDHDVCASHGALETDVKWMHKLTYAILGVLVSAIIYYNTQLNTKFTELNDNVSSIHSILLESKGAHDLELTKVDMRVSSLENLCCSELFEEVNE